MLFQDKSQAKLPVLSRPQDVLHDGHRSLKEEALAPHPMQILQETVRISQGAPCVPYPFNDLPRSGRLPLPQQLRNEWTAKMYLEERVYGAHVAFERRMDRAVLAQVHRLPGVGLPSSHLAVDFVLGRDAKIGFEDYLNREGSGRRRGAWSAAAAAASAALTLRPPPCSA